MRLNSILDNIKVICDLKKKKTRIQIRTYYIWKIQYINRNLFINDIMVCPKYQKKKKNPSAMCFSEVLILKLTLYKEVQLENDINLWPKKMLYKQMTS